MVRGIAIFLISLKVKLGQFLGLHPTRNYNNRRNRGGVMNSNKLKRRVTALSVIALFSAPVFAQEAQPTSLTDGPGIVDLGGGYHTWREQRFPALCINFTQSAGIGGTGNIIQAEQLNYQTVLEVLKAKDSGGIHIGPFSLGRRSSYLRKIVETELSASYTFLYNLQLPVKHVIPDPIQPVSAIGQSALAAGGSNFFNTCGDDYIYERVEGGLLFVTLRYDFASRIAKESFTSSVSISYGPINGSADYSRLSASQKRSVKLTLEAYQEGGDPTQLAALVTNTANGARNCTVEHVTQCNSMINAIDQYALNNFNSSVKTTPTVYGYTTLPYATAGVVGAPAIGPVPLPVINTRLSLGQVLDGNADDGVRAQNVLHDYAPLLEQWQVNGLNALIPTTDRNITRVEGAAQYCYGFIDPANPDGCALQYQTMLGLLETYDRTLLQPPASINLVDYTSLRTGSSPTATIQSSCAAPSGYVVVGVGAIVALGAARATRLRVRYLAPGGILGEPETINCGTGQFNAWVEVPAGHVLIGLGVGATRGSGSFLASFFTNVRLQAYSRQLDVFNARLTGNVAVTQVGGADAEALYLPQNFGLDPDKTIVTGIGLSSTADNITTLQADVARLTR
jgi:hypothetical protein